MSYFTHTQKAFLTLKRKQKSVHQTNKNQTVSFTYLRIVVTLVVSVDQPFATENLTGQHRGDVSCAKISRCIFNTRDCTRKLQCRPIGSTHTPYNSSLADKTFIRFINESLCVILCLFTRVIVNRTYSSVVFERFTEVFIKRVPIRLENIPYKVIKKAQLSDINLVSEKKMLN